MSVFSNLRSGDAVTPGSPANIPCLVDVCSAGIVGNWYTFNPGDTVTDQVGGGPGADQVLALLANTGQTVYFTPAAPTWSPAPSVGQVGTGPVVTCALAAPALGCFDNHTIVFKIRLGGALGAALMDVAYDGYTFVETVPLPQQGPATVIGSAAITPTVLGLMQGTTLTFVTPMAGTITYLAGTLVANGAGLEAATATSTSPVTILPASLLAPGLAVLLANPRRISLTTSGATPANATGAFTITGTDYAGNVISEILAPAVIASTVYSTKAYATITSFAVATNAGTGATVAIGYYDAMANVAELVSATQALTAGVPLATQSQTSGGAFLSLQTVATGTGATISFNAAAGTAAPILGFSNNQTATGTNAVYAPPWTGLAFTFATGSYVTGATYTATATGPVASTSAVAAAMGVARINWRTTPFGFFAITALPSSPVNAAGLQSGCSSTVAPWRNDNTCPVWCMTGTSLHTASNVRATNEVNILANDSALATAFASNAAALDLVAVDDCYVQGSSNIRLGTFRRSAVLAGAIKRATVSKLGSDIAEGIVSGVSLRGPDNLTYARDENTATTKLGPSTAGNTGPGFAVMKSTTAGVSAPKFVAGVTRAGTSSRFRFSYNVAVALQMSQTLFARAQTWEGQTWPTNPTTGSILDSEAAQRADDCYNDLIPFLTPEGKDPSVSQYTVTINNSGPFVNTNVVPLNGSFVTLGIALEIDITVTALGTATQSLSP